MISGFCHRLNEVFALLGCFAVLIDSYIRFGDSVQSHVPRIKQSSVLFGLLDP
jgi:hypothetical protein